MHHEKQKMSKNYGSGDFFVKQKIKYILIQISGTFLRDSANC